MAILLFSIFFIVIMPILAFLGFIKYREVESIEDLIIFIIIGMIIFILPKTFPFKAKTGDSQLSFDILSKTVTGIGTGFIYYAFGGLVNQIVSAWGLIIAIFVGANGLIMLFRIIFDKKIREIWPAPNYLSRAIRQKRMKNYNEAILFLEKAERIIKKKKSDSLVLNEVYHQWGNCYFNREDLHFANDYYSKALEFNPNDFGSLYRRGVCFAKLEQFDKAKKDFKKITTNSSVQDSYHKLAREALEIADRNEFKYLNNKSINK